MAETHQSKEKLRSEKNLLQSEHDANATLRANEAVRNVWAEEDAERKARQESLIDKHQEELRTLGRQKYEELLAVREEHLKKLENPVVPVGSTPAKSFAQVREEADEERDKTEQEVLKRYVATEDELWARLWRKQDALTAEIIEKASELHGKGAGYEAAVKRDDDLKLRELKNMALLGAPTLDALIRTSETMERGRNSTYRMSEVGAERGAAANGNTVPDFVYADDRAIGRFSLANQLTADEMNEVATRQSQHYVECQHHKNKLRSSRRCKSVKY